MWGQLGPQTPLSRPPAPSGPGLSVGAPPICTRLFRTVLSGLGLPLPHRGTPGDEVSFLKFLQVWPRALARRQPGGLMVLELPRPRLPCSRSRTLPAHSLLGFPPPAGPGGAPGHLPLQVSFLPVGLSGAGHTRLPGAQGGGSPPPTVFLRRNLHLPGACSIPAGGPRGCQASVLNAPHTGVCPDLAGRSQSCCLGQDRPDVRVKVDAEYP